jgi:PleD family two-component response regulator
MAFIKTIMLADDDIDDVEVFRNAIDKKVKLEVVSDGKELMSLLNHISPDLLFLDLEMPRKNGLQCLVEIRKDDRLKDIPVVVFSSTTRPVNIQTAYDMGGHLYLIKSHSYNELVMAIKAIIALDWSDPNKIKEQYCINNRFAAFG